MKANFKEILKKRQKNTDLISTEIIQKSRKFKWSNVQGIRLRLIASFFIPILLIIVLGVTSYTKASEGIITNYEEANRTSLTMVSKYFSLELQNISARVAELASNNELKQYYSGALQDKPADEMNSLEAIRNQVRNVGNVDQYMEDIYIVAEYGDGVSHAGTFKTKDYEGFKKSYEVNALKQSGSNAAWIGSHPFIDSEINESGSANLENYSLAYISTFIDARNKRSGYLVADIKKSFILDALLEANYGAGSYTGLITADQREILYTDETIPFHFLDHDFYLESVAGEDASGSKYVEYNDASYLYIYTKLASYNMILCTLIPEAVILKQVSGVRTVTAAIVILAIIIAFLVATFISAGISNALNKTNIILARVAEGDLTVHLDIHRKDEFGVLGSNINHTIQSMKELIGKMTGASAIVSVSSVLMTETTDELFHATKDISKTVNDIEQGISQQAQDAENCLRHMSNLAEQINLMHGNTDEIEAIANSTKNIIGQGRTVVDDLGIKAKDTSEITQSVIKDIVNLEKESRTITDIIRTINDIARQTNLLSLNASIEAARAGEAGKGFAVVASEIRKLAEQSAEAANSIGKIIVLIQQQTQKTVETAKQAEDIVASQEEALTSTIKVFGDVNAHVENLTNNMKRIVAGIAEMEHTKNDTLSANESISATSEESAAATNELGVTVEEQLHSVEKLNESAVKLGMQAKELEATVQFFKVASE
jgi:methyl-accepting chemotaxis protein